MISPSIALRQLRFSTFQNLIDAETDKYIADPDNETLVQDISDANIVISRSADNDDVHYPVIDLDLEASLVESSTPGHYHLYLDTPMSAENYELLLKTLEQVGLIELGYLNSFLVRGHTGVRLPWVKKDGTDEIPK